MKTNRAQIVADGEPFPAGMEGLHMAAGGDITVKYGDGQEFTHVGLGAGFHPIIPAQLVTGGPVEARMWVPSPETLPLPGMRPPLTSEVLAIEADMIQDFDTSTGRVNSWETRDGSVRFTLKDEFSTLPILRRYRGTPYVDFSNVAALEATGFGPTSGDVILYAVVMSTTPVSSYSFTIDTICAGQTGATGATEIIASRTFSSGLFRIQNGSGFFEGVTQVEPFKWYVLTAQYGAGGTASLRLNGIEDVGGQTLAPPAATGMTLGHGTVGGGTSHAQMNIAALFVGDAKPDDTERDEIESYLQAKYARLLAA